MASLLVTGDESALGQLHRIYRIQLLYYALKLSLTRDEAEDIVADSFFKLWQARSSFSSDTHIRNFLFLTTRNSALNLLKYKNRQKGYLEKYGSMQEAVQETFSHERVETELIQLLYSAMENLPGECRKIFQLYLDDQTTAEIANHLQISTATVRSQKRRAIQLLKHWMAERWPGKLVILWCISMHFKDLSPLHYFFFMFLHTQPS